MSNLLIILNNELKLLVSKRRILKHYPNIRLGVQTKITKAFISNTQSKELPVTVQNF